MILSIDILGYIILFNKQLKLFFNLLCGIGLIPAIFFLLEVLFIY